MICVSMHPVTHETDVHARQCMTTHREPVPTDQIAANGSCDEHLSEKRGRGRAACGAAATALTRFAVDSAVGATRAHDPERRPATARHERHKEPTRPHGCTQATRLARA